MTVHIYANSILLSITYGFVLSTLRLPNAAEIFAGQNNLQKPEALPHDCSALDGKPHTSRILHHTVIEAGMTCQILRRVPIYGINIRHMRLRELWL